MLGGEILHSFIGKFIVPTPSREMSDYLAGIPEGKTDIPLYGQRMIISNYYGRNRVGDELARVKVPLGEKMRFERSFHIRRAVDGSGTTVDEGILPFSGF